MIPYKISFKPERFHNFITLRFNRFFFLRFIAKCQNIYSFSFYKVILLQKKTISPFQFQRIVFLSVNNIFFFIRYFILIPDIL